MKGMHIMKKPSIRDVAQRAGVSVTTVSQVLNQKADRFPEATIQKVLNAKEQLGYVPNKNAQQLRGIKTKIIGVLVPSLRNPFFSDMMQSMQEHADADVDLFFQSAEHDAIEDGIKHLVERGVNGLIIAQMIPNPSRLDAYLRIQGIPYVVLDQSDDNGLTDIVRTNEQAGGREMAQYLYNSGHRNIAIVQPRNLTTNMADRVHGFLSYWIEKELQAPLVIKTILAKHGGLAITNSLIQSGVSAVFAINDELAIGILRGMATAGIKVPEQLTVVGYDNTDYSEFFVPSVTTMTQPVWRMGQIALDLVMDRVNHNDLISEPKKIELTSQLIVRESSRDISYDDM